MRRDQQTNPTSITRRISFGSTLCHVSWASDMQHGFSGLPFRVVDMAMWLGWIGIPLISGQASCPSMPNGVPCACSVLQASAWTLEPWGQLQRRHPSCKVVWWSGKLWMLYGVLMQVVCLAMVCCHRYCLTPPSLWISKPSGSVSTWRMHSACDLFLFRWTIKESYLPILV